MSTKIESLKPEEVLKTSRPLWWLSTMMPFVGGYYIVGGHYDFKLFVGALYFAVAYNLAMYGINDIFDYESDMKNPRKGGIHGSVIGRSKHRSLWAWVGITSLPFFIYFFAVGNSSSSMWLAAMVFMVLAYSVRGLRFKEIPFLDSLTSSFHYTSPFIFGVLLAGGHNFYVPAFAAFFIWAAANHAFGAIQDITPDQEAGIASVATYLRAPTVVVLCVVLYLVAAVLPVISYGPRAVIVSIMLAPYALNTGLTFRSRNDDTDLEFQRAWGRLVFFNYAVGFALFWILILGFNRI